ncbi:MAG: NVEALA domain-containing protein [Alistipes sp.]|jgi:hypothetical protein|nr:NVEALA domain-containing protein [Alistipes sp.]
MKRKLFLGLAGVVATTAAVTATVSSVNNAPEISDLMIKNIEALSQYEGSNEVCLSDARTTCTLWLDLGNGCLESHTVCNRVKEYL